MKKILVIDNYDSFTFNLVHYLEELECEVTVLRNDKFDLEDIHYFDKIVLSPRYNNVPMDDGGRYFYINDGEHIWTEATITKL